MSNAQPNPVVPTPLPTPPAAPPQVPPLIAAQPKKKGSAKTVIFIIATVVLFLAALGGWLKYASEAKAHELTSGDLAARETEIINMQATQDAADAEITNLNGTISQLETKNDKLSDELDTTRSELSDYASSVKKLERLTYCDVDFDQDVDFTSNQTVSDSLKEYFSDVDGTVEEADWLVMDPDSRTAMHSVYTNFYSYYFIVYFEDDDSDMSNAIFFINAGCFLDTSGSD